MGVVDLTFFMYCLMFAKVQHKMHVQSHAVVIIFCAIYMYFSLIGECYTAAEWFVRAAYPLCRVFWGYHGNGKGMWLTVCTGVDDIL